MRPSQLVRQILQRGHFRSMSRSMADLRPVFFFDIDNCKDANELHHKYYKTYGLAIEGLVRHHKVDALDYNRKVDDALPLEDVIKPNPQLRTLLQDFDRSKVRLWLLTNAYITHGKRVVKLLDVEDQFEGITYCDYGQERFVCKPHKDMFAKAMQEAGISDHQNCYFVGVHAP